MFGMRAALFALCACTLEAQDAASLLAKARAAFVENRDRERFWNWTTVTNRSIIDKTGTEFEKLPSVTIESPIRDDGKRCNAVMAWGDGTEPYLANASAEERCAVEKETPEMFQMEAFLESRQAKIESRSPTAITLAIREDKAAMEDKDPMKRCVASVRGTLQLDPATFFPKHIEVTMPGGACEQKHLTAQDHYEDELVKNVTAGFTKGTLMRFDYALQKDKAGHAEKDFWICTHRYAVRPLQKTAGGMIVSGRRFPLARAGLERRVVIDGQTVATEFSAESSLKFETVKDN